MEKRDFYLNEVELKERTLDYMSGSWGKHAKTTAVYFLLIAVMVALCVISYNFLAWYFSVIITFVCGFLFILLKHGYNVYCLENTRSVQKGRSLLFSGFGKKMFTIFFVNLFSIIMQLVGLVLLIVPGVYFLIGLAHIDFVIKDDSKLKTFAVIKRSLKLMKGNRKRLFKSFMSFIGWFLLGMISCGIAFLWILPYYNTEKALFYEDLKTDF